MDVVEIGLACPASLMLWFLLSLVDDKRGYWSMVMVMEIGVLSLPPSFLSWAYTRVVFCQLLFYSAALHMPYWAGDLLTPLQTCYRLLLFVACCATLEVEKHAYALRWPRRRSNRCLGPTSPLTSPRPSIPLNVRLPSFSLHSVFPLPPFTPQPRLHPTPPHPTKSQILSPLHIDQSPPVPGGVTHATWPSMFS